MTTNAAEYTPSIQNMKYLQLKTNNYGKEKGELFTKGKRLLKLKIITKYDQSIYDQCVNNSTD